MEGAGSMHRSMTEGSVNSGAHSVKDFIRVDIEP